MSSNATAPSGRKALGNEDRALAYVEWRLACLAVWGAYREWVDAPKRDASLAHAAYGAALDREHAAAGAYARLVRSASGQLAGLADSRCASRSWR
ncbi:MAG TPA: hypothetical protein VFH80_22350 [Solirubrobacteraceae bacterium]|nr:hypothetical protein [Solirubrobacteraceae bacterium]